MANYNNKNITKTENASRSSPNITVLHHDSDLSRILPAASLSREPIIIVLAGSGGGNTQDTESFTKKIIESVNNVKTNNKITENKNNHNSNNIRNDYSVLSSSTASLSSSAAVF